MFLDLDLIKKQNTTLMNLKDNLQNDFYEVNDILKDLEKAISSDVLSKKMNEITELTNNISRNIIKNIERLSNFIERQINSYSDITISADEDLKKLIEELNGIVNPLYHSLKKEGEDYNE